MLEMTATQMIRIMILIVLAMLILTTIYVATTSLFLKQQMQTASDLLSSTGGYMKTEQQQRQWWAITHNPFIRVVSAKYVGITKEDQNNGITTNMIDRGMPGQVNGDDGRTRIPSDPRAFTRYRTYVPPVGEAKDQQGHVAGYIGGRDATFDQVEAKAKQSEGGIALNGPTGVHVNRKLIHDYESAKKRGYMMVPAHYGNSIRFVMESRIPIIFFSGSRTVKGSDMRDLHRSFITARFTMQTTSLRGEDNLYINSKKDDDHDVASSQASVQAKHMLMLAMDQSGVSDSFGFGELNVDLDDDTASAYNDLADGLYQRWEEKIDADHDADQVVNDTKTALTQLNNLFSHNGGTFKDDDGEVHQFKNENGNKPSLVFRAKNGQTFTPETLPSDYHQWPTFSE